MVKKAPAKKVVVKKTAVKKSTAKKPAVKAVAPVKKKVVAKKAAAKKTVKKAAVNKPVIKKAPVKKPVIKKVITVKTPVRVKPTARKVIAKKQMAPIEAPIQLPDATVENAANINKPMMSPGDGLNAAPLITEGPVKTFDKNVFNKVTAKGDPHGNRHFSSKPKNTIKPSGKKPLW